jgi:hypothetical protein
MNRYEEYYKAKGNGHTKTAASLTAAQLEGKKESQATKLVKLAEENFELFITPGDEDAFATIQGRPMQTWPLRSRHIKRYLARQFYLCQEKSPSTEAINNALTTLEGKAWHEGGENPVHVRIGDRRGDICIDLGDKEWKGVVVKPTGWSVVKTHPVKFRRAKGLKALPEPKPGGKLYCLRSFLNLASDSDWHLLIGWLLAAFRPVGPYPVLCLAGEQGSAKSTAARLLRELIDPNSTPLRSEPRDVRDLMIAARNSWVIAFDNLSYLPAWLSDCLCRLSTGGGFSTRELYSDTEEVLFDVMRPVILTSIEDLAQRGDLLERAIVLRLPTIPDDKRRTEKDLLDEFARAKPLILGALLDAVATGLKNRGSVRLSRLPRMADFALWVTACEPALGWNEGAFLEAYCANLREGNELALDSSILTRPIREILESRYGWEGTAADLLDELKRYVTEQTTRSRDWPKSPRGLAGKLRRLAPNLRRVGIETTFDRDKRARTIRLTRASVGDEPSSPSPPSPAHDLPSAKKEMGDGGDRGDAKSGDNQGLGPPPPGQEFFGE